MRRSSLGGKAVAIKVLPDSGGCQAGAGGGRPTLGLAGAALGLAAAQVLGDGLSPWLEGTLGPPARLKARSWVGVLYAGTVLLGLALVALEPKLLVPRASSSFSSGRLTDSASARGTVAP